MLSHQCLLFSLIVSPGFHLTRVRHQSITQKHILLLLKAASECVCFCVFPPSLSCVVVGVLTESADVANVEFECLVVQKLRTDLLRGESVLRLAATRTSAVLQPVSVAGQGQQSKGLITYLLLPVVNKVCTTTPTSITSTLLSRYMLYISFYIVNVTIRVSGNLESTG